MTEYIMKSTSNGWGVYVDELIRCKDCKYWWKEYELCKHPKTCEECGPEFYCGYAERKE